MSEIRIRKRILNRETWISALVIINNADAASWNKSRLRNFFHQYHFAEKIDARKVALMRGIAYFRLNDLKKARVELSSTQVNGKFPAEAAVYLALTDAAEDGGNEKAVETLEKFAATLRKNKSTVQVALARVYMQKGALDKARTQLEEAAKDPQDYEGNALLGELLLKAGVPPRWRWSR